MKCPSYINIETPKGRIDVPCGKCAICLVNKQQDWAFRLYQEQKVSYSSHFITMTYDEQCLPFGEANEPTLDKRDTQLFLKRLRASQFKMMLKHHKKGLLKQFNELELLSIRYYLVGEYGTETNRPHYHAIIFNVLPDVMKKIGEIWNLGHVKVGECNPTTIDYVTKYCISTKTGNQERFNGKSKEFATMSRRPGLGANYIETAAQYHADNQNATIRNHKGNFKRMPAYYKQKLFTESDRENMAQKSHVLQTTRDNREYERLEKLGLNPYLYKQEQQQNTINKIIIKNKKSSL